MYLIKLKGDTEFTNMITKVNGEIQVKLMNENQILKNNFCKIYDEIMEILILKKELLKSRLKFEEDFSFDCDKNEKFNNMKKFRKEILFLPTKYVIF